MLTPTSIEGKTILVTGANRGIGRAVVDEFIARGAKKIYAGVRNLESAAELVKEYGEKVVPLQLDVTNSDDIAATKAKVTDIEILVNNAGVLTFDGFSNEDIMKTARHHFEVNVFGLLELTHALLPHIKNKESGAIVNVGSVVSLVNMPVITTYSASKAAVHSLTQALRAELSSTPILVTGVYPGPIDTDMAKDIDMEKTPPSTVAKNIADGVESGQAYVFSDPFAQNIGKLYEESPRKLEEQFSRPM